MKLREFLNFFDFDYKILENDEIALTDLNNANLGNIESEIFKKDNLLEIVERLDLYYKDYLFDDLSEKYGIDQDNWQALYIKAKKDTHSYTNILNVIMGDEIITLNTIIHDIEWQNDDFNLELPKYMVIPEGIDGNDIAGYISDQVGFCLKSYKEGMIFIDCLNLIEECVKADLIQHKKTENGDYIFVYREAGIENSEGWYLEDVNQVAIQLQYDEIGQIDLINALNEKLNWE